MASSHLLSSSLHAIALHKKTISQHKTIQKQKLIYSYKNALKKNLLAKTCSLLHYSKHNKLTPLAFAASSEVSHLNVHENFSTNYDQIVGYSTELNPHRPHLTSNLHITRKNDKLENIEH
uniref:Uncharacterized protein n=1 Tax=Cannabis sativa TaxID=3483 RepID=A0A803RBN8_CANSA